jgi:hypothetical protein
MTSKINTSPIATIEAWSTKEVEAVRAGALREERGSSRLV